MANGQTSYVPLPNGQYIAVPADATPEQLNALKERVRSWLTAHSEAGQVAARPNAIAQSRAAVTPPALRVDPAKPTTPAATPHPAARAFNEAASGGFGSLPEVGAGLKAGAKKVMSEGPVSAAGDLFQEMMESQYGSRGAVASYPENDYKRYIAAIPGIGPTIAKGEEEGGLTGVMRDLGLVGGLLTANKAMEVPGKLAESTNAAYKQIFDNPKLTMQEGTTALAEDMSKSAASPREYGQSLQQAYDQITRLAGAEKREFITQTVQQHPELRIATKNVNDVLRREVNNLTDLKARNPELFHEGEGFDRTLNILQRELRNTTDMNLPAADARRSQYWNYKQQLDPSMSSRIVGQLDKANTQDIADALAKVDPKLAQEYLQKSEHYRVLRDVGRQDLLKKVFGDKRVAPGRVVAILNQSPEDALAAIRTLKGEDPAAIGDLRRQLFEESVKTAGAKGLFKQQPALIREIYGPQAPAVMQFIDLINRKAATADSLVNRIPGKMGDLLRINAGKSKPAITIKMSEMAKILESSEIMRLFSDAMEMPAKAGPSQLMQDTLKRAIDAAGIVTEEAPTRTPLWKRNGGGGPAGAAPTGGTPPPETPAPGGAERRGSAERRSTGGQSPTGAERRTTAAAQGQLSSLETRLKGATGRDKTIIEEQIASIKAHPDDPVYTERRGQRAPGEKAPKANLETVRAAVKKQEERLREFQEEERRIRQEQGNE